MRKRSAIRRRVKFDPLLPSNIGPVKGREAGESGVPLKASLRKPRSGNKRRPVSTSMSVRHTSHDADGAAPSAYRLEDGAVRACGVENGCTMTSRPAFLADVEQSAWQARIRSLSMKFDYLKTMRDQAIFVAAFFSIFGLITTDMYYSTFGVKYQFLNLNATHMVYRGFTEIYFNPLFFGCLVPAFAGAG